MIPCLGRVTLAEFGAYSHANDVRFGQNVNETRHTVQESEPDHLTVVPCTARDEINTTFDIQKAGKPKPGIVPNNEGFARGTAALRV